MVVPTINLKKIRTKISETKMENNCHHGTLFGTGVVEAKPLDEIKKIITTVFGGPSNLNLPFCSTAVPHYMERFKDV